MQEQIPTMATSSLKYDYKILKLSAQQANCLSFMSDPNSPYHSAPASVKNLFSEDPKDRRIIRITGKLQQFTPIPYPGHICTKIFPSGSAYYTCRECCCQTKPGVTMCYCEGCWQAEKHVGHNVRKQTSYGSAYCDCGREQRIKPQSFCKDHSNKQNKIVQIPEELYKQFIPYYQSLFLCCFYLKLNKQANSAQANLETMIQSQLEKLCGNSLIYIRMVIKILQKKIKLIDSQQGQPKQMVKSGLEMVLLQMTGSQKMIFAMTCDNEFKYHVVKAFRKLKQQKWKPSEFSLLRSELYETDDIFYRLADQNQFISEKKQRYIAIANQSQRGLEMLIKFIQFSKLKLQAVQFLNFFLSLIPQKIQKNTYSKKFAQEYLQITLSTITPYLSYINQMSIDKKVSIFSLTAMLLFTLTDGNIMQVGQHCKKHTQIEQFLVIFCKNVRTLIMKSGQKNEGWLVVYLAIIYSSQKREEHLQALWKGLAQDDNEIREDLIEIVTSIYHLTSITISSPQFFNQFSSKTQNSCELSYESKQLWMRSFLYENNEIPRQKILKLKEQGCFNFPKATQILRQLCTFDYIKDSFCYANDTKYPNYLMRFGVKRGNLDLKSIPSKNWRISDQLQDTTIIQNSDNSKQYPKQLLQMLFSNERIVKYLWSKWLNKIMKKERNQIGNFWRNQNLGYYFALTLIYANVLSNGQNKLLQQCISKLKDEQEFLEIIYLSTFDENKVDQLLQINENNSPAKKAILQKRKGEKKSVQNSPNPKASSTKSQSNETKSPQPQTLKDKLVAAKKLKMLQKLKKSAEKFMGDSKQEIQESPDVENCIICKQSNTESDKLMHLAYLSKNSSPCYNLYGANDKSQIRLNGCLHFIHSNCFSGLAKSNFDFNCPLCAKRCNILLTSDANNKKSLRRCSNIINAIEIVKYKNNDFNGILMTCLKHIVGGGLDWIVYASNLNKDKQKQKERKKKIDSLILKIARQIALKFNEAEFTQFQEQFNSFVQQIESNTKSDKIICLKNCQILIAQAFRSAVFKNKQFFNKKIFEELSEILAVSDQISLVQILSDLLEQEFSLNESLSQKQRIYLTFRCADLPKNPNCFKKNECSKCNKENQKYFCLLCSKSFCQNCLQNESHLSQHNSSILALEVQSKRLVVKQASGTTNGVHHIYYDAYMCSFDVKSKSSWTEQQLSEYEIDKIRFDKIILGYLMRV